MLGGAGNLAFDVLDFSRNPYIDVALLRGFYGKMWLRQRSKKCSERSEASGRAACTNVNASRLIAYFQEAGYIAATSWKMIQKTLTDCPSNLKEAIDWILRVTGKDGGNGGGNGTKALAEKVQRLLQEVQVSDTKLRENIDKVKNALDTGTTGLIAKLADGLQQFIGYEPGSGNTTGKITGGGILPANVAKYQVCNAVLNFVIRFLEGLLVINGVGNTNKEDVTKVIATLRKCVGTGQVPKGFQQLVEGIKQKVKEIDLKVFPGSAGTNLKEVFEALKKVDENSSLEQADNLEPNGVQGFLDHVVAKVKGVNPQEKLTKFTNLCTQLANLFKDSDIKSGKLSPSSPLELKSTLQQNFKNAKNTATINALTLEIDNLRTKTKRPNAATVVSAVRDATHAVVGDLQHKPYTSYYNGADNNKVDNEACAKIFLSCLPLYYHALTYLYWRCDKGGWGNLSLGGGGSNTYTLREFMGSMAFADDVLNVGKNGTAVVGAALSEFAEFSTAMNKAMSSSSYATFTKALKENVSAQNTYEDCPLLALFICASSYFRFQQVKSDKLASTLPSTIREMLYFLAALPYTPVYDELENHITTSLSTPLPVAVSGSATKNETMSSSDLLGILVTSCISSSWVLGTIEGHRNPEPLLYDLFCNNMGFTYPAGPTLLNSLSNYAYALQFQLSFLYQQCSGTHSKACGWNECTYGFEMNRTGFKNPVSTHICPGFKCGDKASSCNHGSKSQPGTSGCTHNDSKTLTNSCGQGSPSPLQAFLTDNLKGFCRKYPSDHSDHLATCSGHTCHVRMGFGTTIRTETKHGSHISLTLKPLCGSCNTPLRQLSEKLGCLTKQTPGTVGDVFGFLWHLNDQLFRNTRPKMETLAKKLVESLSQNKLQTIPSFFMNILNDVARKASPPPSTASTPTVLSRSLETMAPAIPFLYQLFVAKDPKTLPGALFDLTKHCHKFTAVGLEHKSHDTSNSECPVFPNDLWSLYQSLNTQPQQANTDRQAACRKANCGGYLYPLTHTFGSTFAPKHASSYLSWFIHLTEDLEAGLQKILERFKSLPCTNCRQCKAGSHGSPSCSCPSLLECAGVLPLLYEYGFSFNNAYLLRGWKMVGNNLTSEPQNNRTCAKFSNQLSAVLASTADTPMFKLLTSIDDFLYLFRLYFCYNLSAIWMLYFCSILYTFFFILDTLHIRSHLRFSSSHILPPIALLTAGKNRALTKLTYFVP
ncbi:variant erythrocyte surface antigen-1 family protein [Babesia caballi]|uniref:Variant erythrocyte surface antigen-1 family protein n=1 Tax=Babesia caballi TaxID=5871 RepID=A0AAV4LQA4_BABCB|nr:variant erythrocyte surface antigen-1 family protein [Babesia caballi]